MKAFADDNFKFDENGSKLSKRVENIVGKEKLLVTSNFSFSHSVFKRLVSQGREKVSLCGNGLIMPFQSNKMPALDLELAIFKNIDSDPSTEL